MALSQVGLERLGTSVTDKIGERKNLIINGAMQVAQRGDTASVTDGYGGADRFKFNRSGAAVVTLKQGGSGVSPTDQGFGFSQHIDVTTADSSLAAGDYALISYRFEGQDLQQLKKGTANAQQVTLSFHIKSPKTGTHIVELVDQSNSGRHVNKAYTVSSANTWEKKTVTFPMETSNAITNDNARRMDLNWWLAAGSTYSSGTLQTDWGADTNANRAVGQVNCMDNTSNDIYITGVQLELGSVATDFEHRSFAEELMLCRRYYQVILDRSTDSGDDSGLGGSPYATNTGPFVPVRFIPPMRSFPTVESSSAGNEFRTRHGDLVNFDSFTGFNTVSRHGGTLTTSSSGNKVVGDYYWIETDQGNAKLAVVAEL